MEKFIIGKKVGMTQIFDEEGISIPVTVVLAGPCTVVQKKTIDTDGYNSVKIGFEDTAERKANKPDKGQFQKVKAGFQKYLREFRTDNLDKFELGKAINVSDMFDSGDRVDVTGISKGKGFAGTTKRYGTKIGRMTHGSKYHRGVGSMGSSASPGKVLKGKKLPGHMGVDKITVQNLDVVRVDGEKNLMLIKGSVPGPKGALLTIKNTVKA